MKDLDNKTEEEFIKKMMNGVSNYEYDDDKNMFENFNSNNNKNINIKLNINNNNIKNNKNKINNNSINNNANNNNNNISKKQIDHKNLSTNNVIEEKKKKEEENKIKKEEEQKKKKEEENKIKKEEENKKIEELEKNFTENKNFSKKLSHLYTEYTNAKKYLEKISSTKSKEAEKYALKSMELIKKLKNNKTIDESTLPKEITPEFIFNEPIKIRNEKFITAINIIKIKIDEAEKIKNETENEFKKLTNAQFNIRKNEIETIRIKLKNNVDKFKFILKIYLEASRNEWTPAPIIEEKEIDIRKEKFNENCPLNHFILNLSDLSGFNKGTIKIKMKIGENNIEKEFKKTNFTFNQNIQINEKDLICLPKNTLTIGLLTQKKTGFFCCSSNKFEPYGILEFKFDEFRTLWDT